MTAPYVPDANRDLGALIPEVADSARSLQRAAEAAGVHIKPIETRRSQERQDALYAQGRSEPGPVVTWTLHSNHTPGAAVDFLVNNDLSGRDPGYQWLQANASRFGFGVLGSKDPGHVEMPDAVTRAESAQVTPQITPQARPSPAPLPVAAAPSRGITQAGVTRPTIPPPQAPTAIPTQRAPFRAEAPPVMPSRQPFYAEAPSVAPTRADSMDSSGPDPVADYLAAKQAASQSSSQGASGSSSAVDPVSDYLAAKKAATSRAPAKPVEQPGIFSRAGSMLLNAAAHPIDTMESAVTAPAKAIYTLNKLASESDARNAIAESGGPTDSPISVSPGQAGSALLQTAATFGAPGIGGKVGEIAEPFIGKALSKLAGLGVTGATEGAAFNPNDPAAGALAGGLAAPVVGSVAKAGVKAAKLGTTALRVRNATPLGDNALAQSAAIESADKQNYGQAEQEAKAVGGSTPALTSALEHPRIAPYTDRVRSSVIGENADDATVARETYKLMTRQRKGLQAKMDRDGYDADADMEIQNLRQAQRVLKNATTATSQKPPLTMDVPADVTSVAPKVTPGHDAMLGPMSPEAEARAKLITPSRNAAGQLRRNLSSVSDADLEAEYQRLAEANGAEEGAYQAVQVAGYRPHYEELPRTEKMGRPGQEDLPDADGMVDPETLAQDNKTVSAFGRGTLARRSRQAAMDRVQAEIARREGGSPDDFNFGTNKRPNGPAFQLRAQPDKVTPGVEISTPAMRVQTAPAQDVPAVMPSFPKAVAEHAELAQQRQAFNTAADMTKRVMRGTSVAARKLDTQSGPAWLQQINQLPPDQAKAAIQGLLGRAKEQVQPHFSEQPSLYRAAASAVRPAVRLNRALPYLDALDTRANGPPAIPSGSMTELLQRLGLIGAASNFSPAPPSGSSSP